MNRILVEIIGLGKDHSGKVANGDEEHVIGNWRKGDPCYIK